MDFKVGQKVVNRLSGTSGVIDFIYPIGSIYDMIVKTIDGSEFGNFSAYRVVDNELNVLPYGFTIIDGDPWQIQPTTDTIIKLKNDCECGQFIVESSWGQDPNSHASYCPVFKKK